MTEANPNRVALATKGSKTSRFCKCNVAKSSRFARRHACRVILFTRTTNFRYRAQRARLRKLNLSRRSNSADGCRAVALFVIMAKYILFLSAKADKVYNLYSITAFAGFVFIVDIVVGFVQIYFSWGVKLCLVNYLFAYLIA